MSPSGYAVVPRESVRPSRRLTGNAYLVQLAYIPWLPVILALWYVVLVMFSDEPVVSADLSDQGFTGRLANVALYALLALPNWVGAAFGARSRKAGGGRAATIAMWQNLTVGAVLMVLSLIPPSV